MRAAELALLDGGEVDDAGGRAIFSYAHPPFWAPYTIIGDGG
jgi:CHAT domain-containing protein